MKKTILSLFLILCTNISFISAYAANDTNSEAGSSQSKEYAPYADYMLICDVESGYRIYSKNSNISINPYSFTKILTAITVIENTSDLSQEIIVPENILKDYNYTYENIGLTSGEKIAIKDLLYAMIIKDAGDCAIALSNTTFNSYDDFINEMNNIAKKAGAENSVFTEPVGFYDSNQRTTLDDMQKITSYALQNEAFRDITNMPDYEIAPTNKCEKSRIMYTRNYFMSKYYSEDYLNSNISGVMVYTKDSSDCGIITRYSNGADDLLVLAAKSENSNNNNYAFDDALYLIEKGKGFFTEIDYIKKEEFVCEVNLDNSKDTDRMLVVSLEEISLKLPKDYNSKLITRNISLKNDINAPLEKFEEVGYIDVYYDGFKVGSAPLAAYNKIEKSTLKVIGNNVRNFITSIYFWLIISASIVLIVIIRKTIKKSGKKI